MIGKLIRYNRQRGYRFISHNDGSRDQTFVHVKQIQLAGLDVPRDGTVFEFDIVPVKDGKMAAANLRLARLPSGVSDC
jgi:cold shock CspA family protein